MICFIKNENAKIKVVEINENKFKDKIKHILNNFKPIMKRYVLIKNQNEMILIVNQYITKKKLNKILGKLKFDKICLSKNISEEMLEKKYYNYLLKKDRIILKDINKGLNIIFKQLKFDIKNNDIYILMRRISYSKIRYIKDIILNAKNVFIISNNLKKLEELSNYLYHEYGILIIISNNIDNSLKRAKMIINVDEDNLEKYNINRKAIIINLENIVGINKRSFEGKIINDIEVPLREEQKEYFKNIGIYNDFDKNILYQSINISKKYLTKSLN